MTGRWRGPVRFPSDGLDGASVREAGPVITYQLTPAEIAQRYGVVHVHSGDQTDNRTQQEVEEHMTEPTKNGGQQGSYYVMGPAPVTVQEIMERGGALIALLGERAVITVEQGLLVVRPG